MCTQHQITENSVSLVEKRNESTGESDRGVSGTKPHLQLHVLSPLALPSTFTGSQRQLSENSKEGKMITSNQESKLFFSTVTTNNSTYEENAPSIVDKTKENMNSMQTICCNCNSSSELDEGTWMKLENDFITCRTFNVATKQLKNERLIVFDVLKKLYKFDSICTLEAQIKRNQVMCSTCVESLRQLFQLYHEFISLSILSNSALSNVLLSSFVKEVKVKPTLMETNTYMKKSYAQSDTKRKSMRSKRRTDPKIRNDALNRPLAERDVPKIIKSDSLITIISETKEGRRELAEKPEKTVTTLEQDVQISVEAGAKCKNVGESMRSGNDNSQNVSGEDNDRSSSKSIKCDRCTRCFNSSASLKIHYASHLREDKKITCKDCNKNFKTQKAVESHQQIEHNGIKPHNCPHVGCDKRFRLKKKLQLHIKVMHEKRKPYPCPKCEKSFRSKYDLKVHDVGKHVQGDSSIGCSKCRRKFPSREELDKHAKTHEQEKPFICTHCEKGFQTMARLKLHSKSHDEVPSYICSICGKAYKHKRDLLLHEVIHQDESNFRFGCGDCTRRFYRIDLLRNHQSNENHFSPEIVGPSISKFNKRGEGKEKMKGRGHTNGKKPGSQENPVGQKKALNKEMVMKEHHLKRKRKHQSKTTKETVSSMVPIIDTYTSISCVTTSEASDLHIPAATALFSDTLILPPVTQVPLLITTASKDQVAPSIYSSEVIAATDPNTPLQSLSVLNQANGTNLPTFNISAGAEQIGIDVIHAFINNLN